MTQVEQFALDRRIQQQCRAHQRPGVQQGTAAAAEQGRFFQIQIHARLAQLGVEPGVARHCQTVAGLPGTACQPGQFVMQCQPAQVEPLVERLVDAHVEPGFDTLGQKLHRDGVDQRARQDGQQREQQHQPHRQLGTEHPCAQPSPQPQQLPADDAEQQGDHRTVEQDQQPVVFGQRIGIAAGSGQQEQQHRAEADAEYCQQFHRCISPRPRRRR